MYGFLQGGLIFKEWCGAALWAMTALAVFFPHGALAQEALSDSESADIIVAILKDRLLDRADHPEIVVAAAQPPFWDMDTVSDRSQPAGEWPEQVVSRVVSRLPEVRTAGPLCRTDLRRCGLTAGTVLVSVSAAKSDGVSARVTVEALEPLGPHTDRVGGSIDVFALRKTGGIWRVTNVTNLGVL